MSEVNENRMRLWVKWLRDPTHTQTRGGLRNDDNDSFCCLGGACEVYKEHSGNECYWQWSEFIINSPSRILRADLFLPLEVMDWFGLPSKDPKITVRTPDEATSLSTLNDVNKLSFTEIADLIEKEWNL